MQSKVIVVTSRDSQGGETNLQAKIDKEIIKLGDPWKVRSARTVVSAYGASENSNGQWRPDAVYVATILMEKPD